MSLHPFMTYTASGDRVSILNPGPLEPPQDDAPMFQQPLSSSSVPMVDPELGPTSTLKKRRYQCPDCEKVFTTSGHLTRHSKVHTGEKRHHCPFPGCQKSCSRHDNLLQHYRMHLPKDERKNGSNHIREALNAMRESLAGSVPAGANEAPSQVHSPSPSPSPSSSQYDYDSTSPTPSFPSPSSSRAVHRPSPLHANHASRLPDASFSPTTSAPFSPVTPPLPLAHHYSSYSNPSPRQSAILSCDEQPDAPAFTHSTGYARGYQISYMRDDQG